MLRSTTSVVMGLVLGSMLLVSHTMAAGAFDGTYVGKQVETLNDNSGYCRNLTRGTRLSVSNSAIKYSWGGVPLETTVAADGSFSVSAPGLALRGAASSISFKGRISGASLDADVGTTKCAAHLSLKKA